MRLKTAFVSMASIRQNAYSDVLPDFRNLGVIARVLIAVNAAALAAALFARADLAQALERFVQAAALVEPLLLVDASLVLVRAVAAAAAGCRTGRAASRCVALVAGAASAAARTRCAADRRADARRSRARCVLARAASPRALLAYFHLLARRTRRRSPRRACRRCRRASGRISCSTA